ncbi:uncharacterized protein LOC118565830 [Fundulus heteroclitus]|uniref:uncharacterized protein LOC118565830 n=1 Tax=Fundulus heteroclitus TaxID=8078 RepID=UPI00165C73CF|nr:uncharacterized protein LOC118565830 [Fundulus heteroclitus]
MRAEWKHLLDSREKMICRILLLIILNSCLCAATFVVNVTQSSYQAEENHSITLEWTFTTTPDRPWRFLFIYCSLLTPRKESVLYEVHDGVEVSESQDEQFSGRVQSDKDVLREGRIRLHVSRLRTEDSGEYYCDVKTDYGFGSGRCRLNVSVQKNITAEPGKNVSLPCQVPNKKPAVFVKWTRPDLEPEYVLLFRDDQLDPELQHPSYQNRVDLQDRQMKDGDMSLVLENVTTNDRGTYECRVFQREANRRKRHTLTSDPITVIFLDVAPPPENMEGRTEDGSSHQHTGLMAVAGLIITVAVGVVVIHNH